MPRRNGDQPGAEARRASRRVHAAATRSSEWAWGIIAQSRNRGALRRAAERAGSAVPGYLAGPVVKAGLLEVVGQGPRRLGVAGRVRNPALQADHKRATHPQGCVAHLPSHSEGGFPHSRCPPGARTLGEKPEQRVQAGADGMKGLTSSMPQSRKSRTLRVATVKLCRRATAAIWPSGTLSGRPSSLRRPITSP
jgi:hypothetical protein